MDIQYFNNESGREMVAVSLTVQVIRRFLFVFFVYPNLSNY